jgi:truncated hemoglobin YjbI
MSDKNTQEISKIVLEFYQKATTDFLIGYQFRKIQTKEGINPLLPPIEAFSEHLPRIEKFWRMMLTGEKLEDSTPFNLLELHRDLKIRKGELDRWILLFIETLEESNIDQYLKENWLIKIEDFKLRFNRMFFS